MGGARRRAFTGGLLFACLQFSYFVLLEWGLSSAWTTYAAVTLAWLAGILAGLRLPGRMERGLLLANLPAYYGLWLALTLRPFDDRLLPAYAACVFLSGACAGLFFKVNAAGWDARKFLLAENNGFVAGLLLSFAGFSLDGGLFLSAAPAVCALLLI